MARSPLDNRPPDCVQPPYFSRFTGMHTVLCPNGEKLESASREAAWKMYLTAKSEETMAYEKKDGDFALFKNDRKTEDKHPDYSGEIMMNGQAHYLDAWIKKTDKGSFMSGRVGKAKQPKGDAMPTRSNVPPPNEFDSEIPF